MSNFFLFGFLFTIFGLGPNQLSLVSGQVYINETIKEECHYAEAYAELNSTDPQFFFQWFVLNGSSTAYNLGFVSLNSSGYVVATPGQTNSFSDYYQIENEPEFIGQPPIPFKSRLIFDLQNSSVEQFQFRIRWSGITFDTELKNRSVCEMNCINRPCYCGSETQKFCKNDWGLDGLENGTCSLSNQGSISCREVPYNITLELVSDDEIDQPIQVFCNYTEGYPISKTFIRINYTSDIENYEQEITKGENVTLPINITTDYVNASIYCQARNDLTEDFNIIVESNVIVFNVTIPPSFQKSTFDVIENSNCSRGLEINCNPEPDGLEIKYENGTDVTDRLKYNHIFDNYLYQLNVTIIPIEQWSMADNGTYVLFLSYDSTPNIVPLNFDINVLRDAAPGKSLSSGEIAGIVIGCVAGVALIGFIVYFFAFKPKKGKEDY